MQVDAFLENSAARLPLKTALICGTERFAYRDLDERANRLAHSLIGEGIERGDRIAICLENCMAAVVAVFAVLKAGGVFVFINPTTKPQKLGYILSNCGARGLIMSARCYPEAEHAAKTAGVGHIWLAGPSQQSGSHHTSALDAVFCDPRLPVSRPSRTCIDIDLAALIYTSGSTGRPKGVMLTHLNIISAATSITTYLENTEDDIIANLLPLSFDYGLYQVLMAFRIGGTLVLERSFTYPHAVLQTIISEKVTGLPIVPTISAVLLQMDLSAYRFPFLRYITNTAAALPTKHIRRLREQFPNVKLYSMYGLTECKRVSYLPPDQIDRRPTSVGRGMPNEEVYIVDDFGRRVPPGVVGELVVRGSNVMMGYWALPEETAIRLRPGTLPGERVLYTGDLFQMDEDGYLYFFGRKDDIIKSRGEKVSPREIEDVLYTLPGVSEAAVIGVPDDVLGQAIRAFVSLHDGAQLTEQDVLRHCARHLENFMVPRSVLFVDVLPKTASGKIDKLELAAAGEGCRL
jgi:amino acid adenylation domain-containing protein